MGTHRLEVREVPGGRAFYIDGSLQFDSRDEAVYHEALALPALELARARCGRSLDALVLGGGDGLALKRLLAGPVRRAELVDYDPDVLGLARGEFRDFNGGSLDDPRVKVLARDARLHLAGSTDSFDLALADFTFPEDLEGCSLFTRSFFSGIRARLRPGGLFAMNAVSPDRYPAAFWAIYRTLASARLYPRPLRISIPSFSAHGYGDWGMFLASPRPIKDAELGALAFGSGARLDKAGFGAALRLRVSSLERGLPLSVVIKKPGDLFCLINMQEPGRPGGSAMADFADSAAARRLLAGVPGSENLVWPQLSSEWEVLLMGSLRAMDWELFLAELEKSAAALPGLALEEIRLLRRRLPELLAGAVPRADRAWQVFALLMTVLVFVNMAYPDNAYAKGGYSGGRGGSGGSEMDFNLFIQTTRSPFHDKVFQGAAILDTLHSGGRARPAQFVRYKAPDTSAGPGDVKEDRLYFALGDESFVSKAGELFLTPGQQGWLINARPDRFSLLDKFRPEPIFEFYPEQAAIQSALGVMEMHLKAADKALAAYAKWLAWAKPAAPVFTEIRANVNEAKNIESIRASLDLATARLQGGAAAAPAPEIPAGWLRLSPGLYLTEISEVVLVDKAGALFSYPYWEGRAMVYTALPANDWLDSFVTAMLRAKSAQTSPNDPMKGVLERMLDR